MKPTYLFWSKVYVGIGIMLMMIMILKNSADIFNIVVAGFFLIFGCWMWIDEEKKLKNDLLVSNEVKEK